MAFPAVQTTATTLGSTASATPVVNLPTGIVANDLLIVLFRTAIGTTGVGWPGGWTELVESVADASDDAQAIGYRRADGTEGATITLATTSAKFAAVAYRISGAENPTTQAPQVSAAVTGTSATPDPGSLSPTGGAKDYLWLWLGGWEGEQTSPPAGNPTNYTNPLGEGSGTAGVVATNVRVATARRSLNAVSEDPGSWTISASDDWTAWTLAVHPATAQQFTQAVTGGLTFAGAFAKQDQKVLTGGLNFTGAIAKEVRKALTGGLSFAGAITSSFTRSTAFTAALSFAGTFVKQGQKVTTGGLTFTGGMTKTGQKALSGGLSFTGAVTKQLQKALAGGLTFTTAFTAAKLILVTLTATLTFSGALAKQTARAVTGALTFAGLLTQKLAIVRGRPFLFTAANWGTQSFFLEVFMRATGGTVEAELYNITDSVVVTGSNVSTTSATLVRLRSGAITLVNGKEYRLQLLRQPADGGAILSGHIIAK